jgi:hypothetical protein
VPVALDFRFARGAPAFSVLDDFTGAISGAVDHRVVSVEISCRTLAGDWAGAQAQREAWHGDSLRGDHGLLFQGEATVRETGAQLLRDAGGDSGGPLDTAGDVAAELVLRFPRPIWLGGGP